MRSPLLLFILIVKAFVVALYIALGPIGLGPDEAQYWTWSQELDFGYYSKPPGIAWEIWFGTKIFGNTELGVRFGAIILGTLLPLAVYSLTARFAKSKETSFYAGLAMALTPLGIVSSFLAITDTGLALFLTLALAALISKKTWESAFFVGCAALFKWPAYISWLICRSPIMLISLFGLLPSLYWNYFHDFASFRHVFSTVVDSNASPTARGNPLEFIGAQILLLSPILFFLLIPSLLAAFKKKPVPYLASSVVFVLGLCFCLSLFKKMQGNWAVFVYPAAISLIAWFCCEEWKKGLKWLQAGLILSVILTIFVFSIPFLNFPYKMNPFRHNLGWDKLEQSLAEENYDFLFSDKYQITSILSFYNPGQERAYFLNLNGIRNNQFSFWPSMADQELGKTGLFVLAENGADPESDHLKLLKEYFEKVELLGVRTLVEKEGSPVKVALFFRCINYNGKLPPASDLY